MDIEQRYNELIEQLRLEIIDDLKKRSQTIEIIEKEFKGVKYTIVLYNKNAFILEFNTYKVEVSYFDYEDDEIYPYGDFKRHESTHTEDLLSDIDNMSRNEKKNKDAKEAYLKIKNENLSDIGFFEVKRFDDYV